MIYLPIYLDILFYALLPLLNCQPVYRAGKSEIHKTIIRSIFSYGAETFTMNTETVKDQLLFNQRYCRRHLELRIAKVNCRYNCNSELVKCMEI